MTYIDQARAGDSSYNLLHAAMDYKNARCRRGNRKASTGEASADFEIVAHRELARFALERVKEEIERLAKERCRGCAKGSSLLPGGIIHTGFSQEDILTCKAQLEQRRLAELEKEMEALKTKDVRS